MKIKEDAKKVADILEQASIVFTFGNGGSAAIADHMATDWMKSTDGFIPVISLSSNNSLLSAIANDLGYKNTCSAQLEWFCKNDKADKEAVLVLISSSGTSKNIIKAAKTAKRLGFTLIGFTGNANNSNVGKLREWADVSVHCDSTDYGTIEDYHSQVMHEVVRQLKERK